jgi:hypothetical protein
LRTFVVAIVVLAAAGLVAGRVLSQGPETNRSEVFTTAHISVGEAARHFFGIRREPTQPIAFVHQVHMEVAQLSCTDCHISAPQAARAGIPDIRTCWGCHEETLPDHPEIRKIRGYRDRGEDIPWQRVYGWTDESHVRFNHAPHIRADVECATCHGNVAGMGVAERVVEHTMGFCVDCHNERRVSNDCQTCHY